MPFTVYVDVDDTLVRTTSGTVIPIPSVISHVRHLHERGAQLYCWSAGGADYARQTAERLGIVNCFAAFLSKPHLFLDDQQPSEWPGFAVQHPSACSSSPDYAALLQRHSP